MKNAKRTVSYSADDVARMTAGGQDLTDWARIRSSSDDDVERAVGDDPDEAGMVVDWSSATGVLPSAAGPTEFVQVDRDILEFYRAAGPGYQARINATLRSAMERSRKKTG